MTLQFIYPKMFPTFQPKTFIFSRKGYLNLIAALFAQLLIASKKLLIINFHVYKFYLSDFSNTNNYFANLCIDAFVTKMLKLIYQSKV